MRATAALLVVLMLIPLPALGATTADGVLSLPEPRVGDAVAYNSTLVTVVDDLMTQGNWAEPIALQVVAPRTIHDQTGRSRSVLGVQIEAGVGQGYQEVPAEYLLGPHRIHFMDAEDQRFVASTGFDTADSMAPYGDTYLHSQGNWTTTYYSSTADDGVPCGFHLRDPRTLDLGQPVHLFAGDCWLPGHLWFTGGPYTYLRADSWADGNAYAFGAAHHAGIVWVSPDVPYPVRFLFPLSLEHFVVFDLVRFTRGTTALTPTQVGEDLPVVALEAKSRWGPDDSAFSHPWRFSEAFAAAKNHPDESGVRDFLASHPDAYVQTAHFRRVTDVQRQPFASADVEQWRWMVTLDDGESQFAFVVEKTITTAWRPVADGLATPASTSTTDAIYVEPARNAYASARWEDIPSELPSLNALAARWSAYVSKEAGASPEAYGFLQGCDHACFHHEGTHTRVMVRTDSWTTWSNSSAAWGVPRPGPATYQHARIEADATGVLVVQERHAHSPWKKMEPWQMPRAGDFLDGIVAILNSLRETAGEHLDPSRKDDAVGQAPKDSEETTPVAAVSEVLQAEPQEPRAPDATVMLVVAGAAGTAGLGWLVAALFSRLHRASTAAHPVRERIRLAIESEPGIHQRELERRLGIASGVLRHHLGRMTQARDVVAVSAHGYTCYFAGTTAESTRTAAPALRSATARRILDAARQGPASGTQLCAQVGVAPSTLEHHLRRLADAGLVELEVVQHRRMVRCTPLGQAVT